MPEVQAFSSCLYSRVNVLLCIWKCNCVCIYLCIYKHIILVTAVWCTYLALRCLVILKEVTVHPDSHDIVSKSFISRNHSKKHWWYFSEVYNIHCGTLFNMSNVNAVKYILFAIFIRLASWVQKMEPRIISYSSIPDQMETKQTVDIRMCIHNK